MQAPADGGQESQPAAKAGNLGPGNGYIQGRFPQEWPQAKAGRSRPGGGGRVDGALSTGSGPKGT